MRDNEIVPVDDVVLALTATPHPFDVAHRAEAAANWREEIRDRPALFDGAVMLASVVDLKDGVFSATCHFVPYSTLLLWRKLQPVPGTHHIFAMAVPVGSDGAVLAGRMAGHTANAGQIYCPSGSFDRGDLVDGRFDVAANMTREVAEETGLRLDEPTVAAGGLHAVAAGGCIVIFRRYRFRRSAETLAAETGRHIAAEAVSELSAPVVLHRAGTSADFAPHMGPILAWHFADR